MFQKNLLKIIIILFTAMLGCYVLHRNLFWPSGDLIHGDLGDSRFVHLSLEHSWLWTSGARFINSFWTAPWNFYPLKDNLLMSDVLLSSSWNYSSFRWLGLDPATSYQLWFMTSSIVNFLAMFWLSKRLKLRFFGSVLAAWVFAYGMTRGASLVHPQLLPNYFVPISLGLLLLGVTLRDSQKSKSYVLIFLSGLTVGLQFWTSFYLVWFVVLTGIIYLAIFQRSIRQTFKDFEWAKIGLAFAIGFLSVTSLLAVKYLAAQSVVGHRSYGSIKQFLPSILALFLPPSGTWSHRWLFEINKSISPHWHEMVLFPGVISIVCLIYCIRDFVIFRKWTVGSRATIVWIVLMVLAVTPLWKIVHSLIPGATAIRAVGRVSIAGLFPLALVIGYSANRILFLLKKKYGRAIGYTGALLFAFAFFVDQGISPDLFFSKGNHLQRIESVISKIDRTSCRFFHYATRDPMWVATELDAMWASIATELPTINGYSGHWPNGYESSGLLRGVDVTSNNVERWMALNERSNQMSGLCLIR